MFSFKYYRDVVTAPFSFSLKFFIAFSFFVGFLITISLGMAIYSPIQVFTTRFQERANTLYPQDLTITIKNGELTTNAKQPYHFSIPFELFLPQAPAIPDDKQEYFLTIDTKATPDTYKANRSFFLLTRDSLVIPTNDEATQTIPFKQFDDLVINKTTVDGFINHVLPLLHLLFPLTIASLLFFLIVIWPLARFVGLVFLSLLLRPISRLMGLQLPFKKILQISLHSHLLPVFIQITMFLFGLQPPILFFNALLFLLYNLIIFAELKSSVPQKTGVV